MGNRKGNKKRLYISAKRKKHHFSIKRHIHLAPSTIASDENKENSDISQMHETFNDNVFEANTSSTSESDFDLTICYDQHLNNDNDIDETVQHKHLEGRRIVNIKYFFSQLSKIKHEHTDCTFADLKFLGELRTGFISKYKFECKMCTKKEIVYSEDPKLKLSANDAVVEGIVCSGNGYGQLNEICSVLNMPVMSNTTYTRIEQRLTPKIEECAIDEMIAAGQEEKRLAVLNGDLDNDGCPLISVVADGSWAKRSYKSGFSSASGAGCIVGLRTKKVLFLGIRNSYCCICSRSAKLNILDVPEHRCFKNWNDSANAMEADIIAEGFAKSMEMHGVKYNKLIGDGDSSVIKKLLLNKPYGHDFTITKIECKNHLLRNFCNKIKALAKKTNNHKGFVPVDLRKKVQSNVLRLRKAVVGAVNHRKEQNNDHGDKIKNLKMDIKNAANHVFGDHKNCASYYCKPEKYTNDTNLVPDLQSCGIWADIQQYLLMLV